MEPPVFLLWCAKQSKPTQFWLDLIEARLGESKTVCQMKETVDSNMTRPLSRPEPSAAL